jgi:hypothetical protein
MGQESSVVAAWIIVGIVTVSFLLASVFFLLDLWYRRRAATYRVSTIIISRNAFEDAEPPPVPLTAEHLAAMGASPGGGDVCFLATDKPLGVGHEPCFICYERAPVDVSGVCGHGGMCAACFTRVWAHPNARCPICRGLMRCLPGVVMVGP